MNRLVLKMTGLLLSAYTVPISNKHAVTGFWFFGCGLEERTLRLLTDEIDPMFPCFGTERRIIELIFLHIKKKTYGMLTTELYNPSFVNISDHNINFSLVRKPFISKLEKETKIAIDQLQQFKNVKRNLKCWIFYFWKNNQPTCHIE